VNDEIRSVLVGTAGLSVAAAVAAWLTVSRAAVAGGSRRTRAAISLAVAAIVCQAAHFGEELATGFHLRFPAWLGLAPWPPAFFVSFNLIWLAVWAVSCPALASGWRAAAFPIWFLAIAGVVNGVAHPLLSLAVRGYFPGLVTSPLVGIAGLLLFRTMRAATV
jgi:hypothetical protein